MTAKELSSGQTRKPCHVIIQICLSATTFIMLTITQLWVEFSNHSIISLAILKLLFCLDFFLNATCFIWINRSLLSQMKRMVLCQKIPPTITTMFAVALFLSKTTRRTSVIPAFAHDKRESVVENKKYRNVATMTSESSSQI